MALIQLQNINKSYGKGKAATPVLHDISFTVNKGEFVAVVGASGSGKTTLMNIIGLLDKPSNGQYLLEGQDTAKLKDRHRAKLRRNRIGFVFQNFNLIPRLSALGNVELPLIYDRASKKDRSFRARRLLKLVGLEERIKFRPNELSGGQMQRVAIARALSNSPSIILADEPTGNLDSKTGETILKIFMKLNKRGNTFVLITHDPNVAKYATRTITMRDGHIVKETKP